MNFILTKIHNRFPENSLYNVEEITRRELKNLPVFKTGASIAIGVGSRGIDQLPVVVKETVAYIKERGGIPFIIPAMGSHGGATAAGQKELLESYGISESSAGALVKSSMDAVELAVHDSTHVVYMDKNAFESDGVILINKIKPHTDFHSTYESGLVKMSVIGLGKEKGAEAIHRYGVKGLKEFLPESARRVMASGKILAGIGLVENAYDRLMKIKVIPGHLILEEEPALLDLARKNQPRLPVENIDVLLVDRMGKNISGVGMDTNIIGRLRIYGQEEPDMPDIKSIIISDLTEESHGNATGVGLADVITRRLYEKIDFDTTYKNIITSSFLERAKIPVVARNDHEALTIALRNCGLADEGRERIIRIQDTLHLGELYVSDVILHELRDRPEIQITGEKNILLNDNNDFTAF